MDISKELIAIRTILNMNQEELAEELELTFETINRWENLGVNVEERDVKKVYDFAYSKKIFLNDIFAQLIAEEYKSKNTKVLFHGCKTNLNFPIDLKHSKQTNDFGIGFYLGETFKQAANYISISNSPNVYSFALCLDNLNIAEFHVNKEWMLAISYYRGWIDSYKDNEIVKNICKRVNGCDVIIAPIADNRMFDIISEFVRGEITDMQCEHALATTNLGFQYVIRTPKAINQLKLIRQHYLTKKEKEKCYKERLDMSAISQSKVKVARIEYRGKGQYIDEILK